MAREVGFDRRQWLANASVGVIGGNLLASAALAQSPLDSDREIAGRKRFLSGPADPCPQVVKLSKNLDGEISLTPGNPCKCERRVGGEVQIVFFAEYRAILKFRTNQSCDETDSEPLLQFGSELWLEGKLTLRQDKCKETGKEVFIGGNQGTFRFHRYRPNEDVMKGAICGAEGLLPFESAEKRCCAIGRGLGAYCGEGLNTLDGWSVAATYQSQVEGLTATTLCKQSSLKTTMAFDGVLISAFKRNDGGRKS